MEKEHFIYSRNQKFQIKANRHGIAELKGKCFKISLTRNNLVLTKMPGTADAIFQC